MKDMSRRLRYLWQMPLYLLGLLLMLEALLQLGALVVQDQARLVPARWLTGNTRILALGDSNTYGLYLSEQEAWPFQLQQQLNALHPERPVEVLNLGYPATNSFRVRDNLPALLEKLSPDIVLIMVGFNDFWTPLEDLGTARSAHPLDWLKHHSRIYRFCLIAARSRVGQEDLVFGYPRGGQLIDIKDENQRLIHVAGDTFYMGTKPGDPPGHRQALRENLTAMIESVRATGAQVYLLTYPSSWGFYPGANKWLRTVAEEQGAPLIDISPLFQTRCQDGPVSCPDLLFHDGHATSQGNALVAREVGAALRRQ